MAIGDLDGALPLEDEHATRLDRERRDPEVREGAEHALAEAGAAEPAAAARDDRLAGRVATRLQQLLRGEPPAKDGGGDPLGPEPGEDRGDVGDARGDETVDRAVEARRLPERERDDAEPAPLRFPGDAGRQGAGPAHQAERALHGRCCGQASSPCPSRIIRSISSATASERMSSLSGSSTVPVSRARRMARIRWRISSFRGLSLCTNRCSTNDAWR